MYARLSTGCWGPESGRYGGGSKEMTRAGRCRGKGAKEVGSARFGGDPEGLCRWSERSVTVRGRRGTMH